MWPIVREELRSAAQVVTGGRQQSSRLSQCYGVWNKSFFFWADPLACPLVCYNTGDDDTAAFADGTPACPKRIDAAWEPLCFYVDEIAMILSVEGEK